MSRITIEVPFKPDVDELVARLGMEADSEEAEDFRALLEELRPFAIPRAAILCATVEEADRESGRVVLDGVAFQSRVLAGNIGGQERVWAHVATCGRELYDRVMAIPDAFERYWGEEVMQASLAQARVGMLRRLESDYKLGKVATMGPGSLLEWPIEQQKPLFALLGEGVEYCGVELTESLLMLPNKSVSGILFASENGWESCVMCPRKSCPNRRARYDPDFSVD